MRHEKAGVANDGRQWRAQLVCHRGEKEGLASLRAADKTSRAIDAMRARAATEERLLCEEEEVHVASTSSTHL